MQDAWHHYLAERRIPLRDDVVTEGLEDAFLSGARAAYGLLYVLFHLADGMDEASRAFETLGEELGIDQGDGSVDE